MTYPHFFDTLETIRLYDPLSEALGAFENGMICFSYKDIVQNAGHSCPTIAGAYLMVREGLKALYNETMPQRGNIAVFFRHAQAEGTTGVVANVFSQITGATSDWGFKGIGGAYARVDRLFFNAPITLDVKMQRLDTKRSIEVAYDPSLFPNDPELSSLLFRIGTLSKEEKYRFQHLWQERVRKILENFDKVIRIKS